MSGLRICVAVGATLAMLGATAALAQSGTTSGPAAGTTVQPSGANQSTSAGAQNTQNSSSDQLTRPAVGSGAPGVAAKPGDGIRAGAGREVAA